jgi:hypothetical protein
MNDEANLTAMLIPFYLGERPDSEGRMLQDMWAWEVEALECAHDYIQWWFPIAEKSMFNSNAPVLDETVIQAFHRHPQLRQNLRRSWMVMLQFYGLQFDRAVTRSADYSIRKSEWVQRFNHNYLRITRILKCLMTLGLESEARSFYECLREIYREEPDQIGGETFQYWTGAVALDQ